MFRRSRQVANDEQQPSTAADKNSHHDDMGEISQPVEAIENNSSPSRIPPPRKEGLPLQRHKSAGAQEGKRESGIFQLFSPPQVRRTLSLGGGHRTRRNPPPRVRTFGEEGSDMPSSTRWGSLIIDEPLVEGLMNDIAELEREDALDKVNAAAAEIPSDKSSSSSSPSHKHEKTERLPQTDKGDGKSLSESIDSQLASATEEVPKQETDGSSPSRPTFLRGLSGLFQGKADTDSPKKVEEAKTPTLKEEQDFEIEDNVTTENDPNRDLVSEFSEQKTETENAEPTEQAKTDEPKSSTSLLSYLGFQPNHSTEIKSNESLQAPDATKEATTPRQEDIDGSDEQVGVAAEFEKQDVSAEAKPSLFGFSLLPTKEADPQKSENAADSQPDQPLAETKVVASSEGSNDPPSDIAASSEQDVQPTDSAGTQSSLFGFLRPPAKPLDRPNDGVNSLEMERRKQQDLLSKHLGEDEIKAQQQAQQDLIQAASSSTPKDSSASMASGDKLAGSTDEKEGGVKSEETIDDSTNNNTQRSRSIFDGFMMMGQEANDNRGKDQDESRIVKDENKAQQRREKEDHHSPLSASSKAQGDRGNSIFGGFGAVFNPDRKNDTPDQARLSGLDDRLQVNSAPNEGEPSVLESGEKASSLLGRSMMKSLTSDSSGQVEGDFNHPTVQEDGDNTAAEGIEESDTGQRGVATKPSLFGSLLHHDQTIPKESEHSEEWESSLEPLSDESGDQRSSPEVMDSPPPPPRSDPATPPFKRSEDEDPDVFMSPLNREKKKHHRLLMEQLGLDENDMKQQQEAQETLIRQSVYKNHFARQSSYHMQPMLDVDSEGDGDSDDSGKSLGDEATVSSPRLRHSDATEGTNSELEPAGDEDQAVDKELSRNMNTTGDSLFRNALRYLSPIAASDDTRNEVQLGTDEKKKLQIQPWDVDDSGGSDSAQHGTEQGNATRPTNGIEDPTATSESNSSLPPETKLNGECQEKTDGNLPNLHPAIVKEDEDHTNLEAQRDSNEGRQVKFSNLTVKTEDESTKSTSAGSTGAEVFKADDQKRIPFMKSISSRYPSSGKPKAKNSALELEKERQQRLLMEKLNLDENDLKRGQYEQEKLIRQSVHKNRLDSDDDNSDAAVDNFDPHKASIGVIQPFSQLQFEIDAANGKVEAGATPTAYEEVDSSVLLWWRERQRNKYGNEDTDGINLEANPNSGDVGSLVDFGQPEDQSTTADPTLDTETGGAEDETEENTPDDLAAELPPMISSIDDHDVADVEKDTAPVKENIEEIDGKQHGEDHGSSDVGSHVDLGQPEVESTTRDPSLDAETGGAEDDIEKGAKIPRVDDDDAESENIQENDSEVAAASVDPESHANDDGIVVFEQSIDKKAIAQSLQADDISSDAEFTGLRRHVDVTEDLMKKIPTSIPADIGNRENDSTITDRMSKTELKAHDEQAHAVDAMNNCPASNSSRQDSTAGFGGHSQNGAVSEAGRAPTGADEVSHSCSMEHSAVHVEEVPKTLETVFAKDSHDKSGEVANLSPSQDLTTQSALMEMATPRAATDNVAVLHDPDPTPIEDSTTPSHAIQSPSEEAIAARRDRIEGEGGANRAVVKDLSETDLLGEAVPTVDDREKQPNPAITAAGSLLPAYSSVDDDTADDSPATTMPSHATRTAFESDLQAKPADGAEQVSVSDLKPPLSGLESGIVQDSLAGAEATTDGESVDSLDKVMAANTETVGDGSRSVETAISVDRYGDDQITAESSRTPPLTVETNNAKSGTSESLLLEKNAEKSNSKDTSAAKDGEPDIPKPSIFGSFRSLLSSGISESEVQREDVGIDSTQDTKADFAQASFLDNPKAATPSDHSRVSLFQNFSQFLSQGKNQSMSSEETLEAEKERQKARVAAHLKLNEEEIRQSEEIQGRMIEQSIELNRQISQRSILSGLSTGALSATSDSQKEPVPFHVVDTGFASLGSLPPIADIQPLEVENPLMSEASETPGTGAQNSAPLLVGQTVEVQRPEEQLSRAMGAVLDSSQLVAMTECSSGFSPPPTGDTLGVLPESVLPVVVADGNANVEQPLNQGSDSRAASGIVSLGESPNASIEGSDTDSVQGDIPSRNDFPLPEVTQPTMVSFVSTSAEAPPRGIDSQKMDEESVVYLHNDSKTKRESMGSVVSRLGNAENFPTSAARATEGAPQPKAIRRPSESVHDGVSGLDSIPVSQQEDSQSSRVAAHTGEGTGLETKQHTASAEAGVPVESQNDRKSKTMDGGIVANEVSDEAQPPAEVPMSGSIDLANAGGIPILEREKIEPKKKEATSDGNDPAERILSAADAGMPTVDSTPGLQEGNGDSSEGPQSPAAEGTRASNNFSDIEVSVAGSATPSVLEDLRSTNRNTNPGMEENEAGVSKSRSQPLPPSSSLERQLVLSKVSTDADQEINHTGMPTSIVLNLRINGIDYVGTFVEQNAPSVSPTRQMLPNENKDMSNEESEDKVICPEDGQSEMAHAEDVATPGPIQQHSDQKETLESRRKPEAQVRDEVPREAEAQIEGLSNVSGPDKSNQCEKDTEPDAAKRASENASENVLSGGNPEMSEEEADTILRSLEEEDTANPSSEGVTHVASSEEGMVPTIDSRRQDSEVEDNIGSTRQESLESTSPAPIAGMQEAEASRVDSASKVADVEEYGNWKEAEPSKRVSETITESADTLMHSVVEDSTQKSSSNFDEEDVSKDKVHGQPSTEIGGHEKVRDSNTDQRSLSNDNPALNKEMPTADLPLAVKGEQESLEENNLAEGDTNAVKGSTDPRTQRPPKPKEMMLNSKTTPSDAGAREKKTQSANASRRSRKERGRETYKDENYRGAMENQEAREGSRKPQDEHFEGSSELLQFKERSQRNSKLESISSKDHKQSRDHRRSRKDKRDNAISRSLDPRESKNKTKSSSKRGAERKRIREKMLQLKSSVKELERRVQERRLL
eukprot:scaffold1776_cov106-Cylindrotheca_fusiformis.AAC.9